MKNKRGLPFIVIGLLLVAAALSLSAYNVWDESRAAKAADSTLEELLPQIPDPVKLQENSIEKIIPDYILNPKMDMPELPVGDYNYVGYLTIPAIDIQLPVMSKWNYRLLKVSPCRYVGTAYQNDLVIAAHNYDHHFGRLPQLNVGDEVTFTDTDGNIFRYAVGEMETLRPTAIKEMTKSDWDLTLFTCTIGGRARFTVRCELVEAWEPFETME